MGSYTLHINPEHNYAHITLSGDFSQIECETALQSSLHALDALSPGFAFITDYRGVTSDHNTNTHTKATELSLLHDALIDAGVGFLIRIVENALSLPGGAEESADRHGLSAIHTDTAEEALFLAGIPAHASLARA